ncbi:MAG: O-antigen ligase family protein [Chloroflexota bacterium]
MTRILAGARGSARSFDWAWALMLLLLPITSLPLLSRLAGGTAVAPASILPLVWLVVWFVCFVFKKGTLPRESIPFLGFVSAALVSCALAFFMEVPTFKANSIVKTEAESLLTLGIGTAFYFVSAAWLSSCPERLNKALRLINLSGLILLSWAGIQAIYILFFNSQYPDILYKIQDIFATRQLFSGRVAGFAFEPSWLAHQINLLFLPFWLAATVKGSSVHPFRLWKITLENILLVLGLAIVLLSSRVGTLGILLVFAFLGIRWHVKLMGKLFRFLIRLMSLRGAFFATKQSPKGQFGRFDRRLLRQRTARNDTREQLPNHLHVKFFFLRKMMSGVIVSFVFIPLLFFYAGVVVGLIYVLSHFDWRFERLLDLSTIRAFIGDPLILSNWLVFGERFVYWLAGWRVFNDYPFFGVGLGNAGLYFQQALPAYGWSHPEVMDVYYRASAIPNIKSFWVRILAETGLVGFAMFVSWFYVLWRSGRMIENSGEPLLRTVGLAGQIVLVAFLAEGFSVDTFALPYLWVSLGLLSAASALFRRQMSEETASGIADESK